MALGSSWNRARPATLVWIDGREAIIARWSGDAAELKRLESHIPARHRSTGRVRHRPLVRHGGGGVSQGALERSRRERVARFIDRVAQCLREDEDMVILGPGHIRDRLCRSLERSDLAHRVDRSVRVEPAGRLSERQLIARLRMLHGWTPRRQKVEGYPWFGLRRC